jgi:hypothetical protein
VRRFWHFWKPFRGQSFYTADTRLFFLYTGTPALLDHGIKTGRTSQIGGVGVEKRRISGDLGPFQELIRGSTVI